MLAIGCSSNGSKESKESEELQYADDQFISDMAKGLQARWKLNDEDENKEDYDKIALQSSEEKEMMLSYIQAELDCIEKYTDEKFKDSALQENAVTYINLLKKHKEICDYIPVDYAGKYLEEFQPIYDERSKIIEDMVNNYGLTVDEEYQETLDEFKTNSQLVKDQEAMEEAIKNMLNNIQFQMTEDDGDGWKTYQGIVENTTGKDFSNLSVNINLKNADGVIVETTYDQVSNFTNGSKAQFEFRTDKDFASTEVTSNYYEN